MKRNWDDPHALDQMDSARERHLIKRTIAEAEAAIDYAAWRQQTELEIEALYGVTFDPDNPRNFPVGEDLAAIEAESEAWQVNEDLWQAWLDESGLL
jgi:hypothetical protein